MNEIEDSLVVGQDWNNDVRIIHKQPVLNKDALRNPDTLEYYSDIKELQED